MARRKPAPKPRKLQPGSSEWWDTLTIEEKGRIQDVLRRKTIDKIILLARQQGCTEDMLASVLPFLRDEQLRAICAVLHDEPEAAVQ